MTVRGTGVRATADEIAEAKVRASDVRHVPIIRVHGGWAHELAREAFMSWIDRIAWAHGLPRRPMLKGEADHYGLSNEGEFTVFVPDGVEHPEVP